MRSARKRTVWKSQSGGFSFRKLLKVGLVAGQDVLKMNTDEGVPVGPAVLVEEAQRVAHLVQHDPMVQLAAPAQRQLLNPIYSPHLQS